MCMIIYRPAHAASQVDRTTLKYIASMNRDGFGLMWPNAGRLITVRFEPRQSRAFIDRFLALQRDNVPLCAHFRWSTHGAINRANTHPITIVPDQLAMMHNGILDIKTRKNWSDTRTFVELAIKRLPPDWWGEGQPYPYLLEQATSGSRLAFMWADGQVMLLHEKAGWWVDGVWFSNSGHKPITKEDKQKEDDDKRWAAWKSQADGHSSGNSSKNVPVHFNRSDHYSDRGYSYHHDVSVEWEWENYGGKTVYRKRNGPDPVGETEKLWYYEGVILCDLCLDTEALHKAEAIEIPDITPADECDLCGARGKLANKSAVIVPQPPAQPQLPLPTVKQQDAPGEIASKLLASVKGQKQ